MSKYTKLSCVFIEVDEVDYAAMGIYAASQDTDIGDIYVDLECISHYHETNDDNNINIFINGEKWTIEADINEFDKLMNNK